jgi:phosphoribosylformimino-5-aminoimidazole carboxamide ribotide isomerase
MLLIPAVDIRGGKAVRLCGGDYEKETVYSADPAEAACRWRDEGAEYLHVVDLDGAREGVPVNAGIVEEIVRRAKIPVEAGGGVRTMDAAARYIDSGADMVILGTGACSRGDFMEKAVAKYGDRIAVSLDLKDGKAAVWGWMKTMDKSVASLLEEFEGLGAGNLIFTDISRDGLLKGINISAVKGIVEATSIKVTVAGGVSSLEDIIKLNSLEIRGAIVGKALYSGDIILSEALKCLKK